MSSADHEEGDAGTVSAAAMNPNRVASHHSLDVLATVAETVSVSDRDPDGPRTRPLYRVTELCGRGRAIAVPVGIAILQRPPSRPGV